MLASGLLSKESKNQRTVIIKRGRVHGSNRSRGRMSVAKTLFGGVGFKLATAKLRVDKMGAMLLVFLVKGKHFDIRRHFVREAGNNEDLKI